MVTEIQYWDEDDSQIEHDVDPHNAQSTCPTSFPDELSSPAKKGNR